MYRKKIALLGLIALVVIGCVLAAGCTSTSTQSQPTPTTPVSSTDNIVGVWKLDLTSETVDALKNIQPNDVSFLADAPSSESFSYIYVFYKDGTGTKALIRNSDGMCVGGSYLPLFTWKNTGENKYILDITRENLEPEKEKSTETYTLDSAKGILTLVDNTAVTIKKQTADLTDSGLVGTWKLVITPEIKKEIASNDSYVEDGSFGLDKLDEYTCVCIINSDCSAKLKYINTTDGTENRVWGSSFKIMKVSPTKYYCFNQDGTIVEEITYDSAKGTLFLKDSPSFPLIKQT